MAVQVPLVLISGRTKQLPSGDTLGVTITGSAATLTTPRAIYGNNFDGSAELNQVIASTYGGTGNGFVKFTGPTTAEKTFTLPNASATLLYSGGALGTPSSGTGTNITGIPAANVLAGTFGTGSYTVDTNFRAARIGVGGAAAAAAPLKVYVASETSDGGIQLFDGSIHFDLWISSGGSSINMTGPGSVPVTGSYHTLRLMSTDTPTTGTGGGFAMGGIVTGSTYGLLAEISGVKENSNDNDTASVMNLKTRVNGGNMIAGISISSVQAITMPGTTINMTTSGTTLTVGVGADNGTVSAGVFTDRTKHFAGDATAELLAIKGKNGHIDHDTLPVFARANVRKTKWRRDVAVRDWKITASDVADGEIVETERDMGAMISMLVVDSQQKSARIAALEARLNQ